MAKTTSAADWLYSRAGKIFGPMSAAQLKALCQTGQISTSDLVSRFGSEQWVAAETIPDLFPGSRAPCAVVEDVPIHPIAADVADDVDRADCWWRTAGAMFCAANLGLCAIVGLAKGPPESVRMIQEINQDMQGLSRDLKSAADAVKADLEDRVKDIQQEVEERGERSRN